jgi:hypothetical protein
VDLVRLGLRSAKRNWSRTALAMTAMALAAMTSVFSGVVPLGYVKGHALAERLFVGGDILVLPIGGPVDARWDSHEESQLFWKPWEGRDWQSSALYFLPGLRTKGYVSNRETSWRAFDPNPVIDAVKRVQGVKDVAPYYALPCILTVGGQSSAAVLRAWDTSNSGDYLSDFGQEFVVAGEPLDASSPKMSCLFPLQGTSLDAVNINSVDPLSTIQITVPRLTYGSYSGEGPIGFKWDQAVTDSLQVSGIYQVQVGLAPSPAADSPSAPTEMEPLYWERPEIIVSYDTFRRFVSYSEPTLEYADKPDDSVDLEPGQFPSGFSVYQVAITVDRMATVKKVAEDVALALGSSFAVIPIPELTQMKGRGALMTIAGQDAREFSQLLFFTLSSVIVAGTIYVILTQERRKIGLLRVVGATGKDILAYALTLCAYVALTGSAIGFGVAKILSLLAVFAADVTFSQWVEQTVKDALQVFGLSLGIPLVLGLAIGVWAARIPSAEVLERG